LLGLSLDDYFYDVFKKGFGNWMKIFLLCVVLCDELTLLLKYIITIFRLIAE